MSCVGQQLTFMQMNINKPFCLPISGSKIVKESLSLVENLVVIRTLQNRNSSFILYFNVSKSIKVLYVCMFRCTGIGSTTIRRNSYVYYEFFQVTIAQQSPRQKSDKTPEIPVLSILLGLFFILFLLLCLLINVACFHSSNNVCPYKECEVSIVLCCYLVMHIF